MTIADIVPITCEATNTEIFSCAEFGNLTVLEIDNEPWFVGKEIAEKLGYIKPNKAIDDHVDLEDIKVLKYGACSEIEQATLWKGNDFSNKKIINESGFYSLIGDSKLPNAKKFKRWVTSEVLPSIRKHGMYATEELLDNPDLLIQAATKLKEEREKNRLLQEQNKKMKPKALFADAVASSDQSILVGELAKLLKQNGVKTGEKRLFQYLRDNGYLIKRQGSDHNLPTQRSMELGIMEIKETVINKPNGDVKINKTTKITGKGQTYFIDKFLSAEQIGMEM